MSDIDNLSAETRLAYAKWVEDNSIVTLKAKDFDQLLSLLFSIIAGNFELITAISSRNMGDKDDYTKHMNRSLSQFNDANKFANNFINQMADESNTDV